MEHYKYLVFQIYIKGVINIIHFIIGKSGTGKSQTLINAINNTIENNIFKGNNNLNSNIDVIVPEQFSFEFDKKLYEIIDHPENFSSDKVYSQSLYNGLGAYKYNHINVTKFSKLAGQIISDYGNTSKDYINELSKIIAMYQTVRNLKYDGKLKFLERQSNSANFFDLALSEIAELKKSNISPDILEKKSANFPQQLRDKSLDIVEIYKEYNNILSSKNLQDSLSDILECNNLVKINKCFENHTIFIDEFDAFTNDEIQLLDTIFSQCKDFYISLRTNNRIVNGNISSKATQFETVDKTYIQLLDLAKKHNQQWEEIFCDTAYRYKSIGLKTISENVLSNNKKDRVSCEQNVSIIECFDYYQECDYVCSQIRNLIIDEKYSYNDIFVTARHIDDYMGIMERSFKKYDIPYFLSTDKSSIYTSIMVYFTNLLEILANNSFNTDAILRYVKNPIMNISFEMVSDLENYCYKWNVKGKMWLDSFIEDDNVTADNIRQNIILPIIELRESIKDTTCLDICQKIFNFMENQSIRKNIQNIINANKSNGMDSVADEMVRIWDMLVTILDTLCNFMGDEHITIKDFKDVVCAMINQSKFKIAPQKLDAVSFSASDNARFNSPKILFVLGANDGVFPSVISNTGIFTSSDMEYFSQVGLKFSKSLQDKTADEKLVVYKTLSAPSEKIFISYVLRDIMGDDKYASYVVNNVVNLFTDLNIKTFDTISPKDICSTFKSSYDYYVKNFWNNSETRTTVESVLRSKDIYSSKLDYLLEISNDTQFKIQDRKLALKLFKNKIKIYATKFETFNKCHFKYFCSEGLKIKKTLRTDISSIEIGNIIHECLEKIIKNNDNNTFINLTKKQIQLQIESIANEYKKEHLGGDYGKNQRFEANFKRVKNSILQTIQHIQMEFSQLQFIPSDFELSIDDNNQECKPLSIKNQDGMEILLCGKVDRVDIMHTDSKSYVRIVDYKSGTQKFEPEKLPYGIDMQMFLYLFAITGDNAKYSHYTPAGVLYMPVSEVKITNSRTDKNKSTSKTINEHFRMKGVVLDDINVIKAMDNTLEGTYIPFKKNPRNFKNMTLTENQFNQIREYAESLIINMANCLCNGDISAKALVFYNEDNDDNKSVCNYCDYWSICGKYPKKDCKFVQKDEALELYNKIISKEGDNNED